MACGAWWHTWHAGTPENRGATTYCQLPCRPDGQPTDCRRRAGQRLKAKAWGKGMGQARKAKAWGNRIREPDLVVHGTGCIRHPLRRAHLLQTGEPFLWLQQRRLAGVAGAGCDPGLHCGLQRGRGLSRASRGGARSRGGLLECHAMRAPGAALVAASGLHSRHFEVDGGQDRVGHHAVAAVHCKARQRGVTGACVWGASGAAWACEAETQPAKLRFPAGQQATCCSPHPNKKASARMRAGAPVRPPARPPVAPPHPPMSNMWICLEPPILTRPAPPSSRK